MNIVDQFLGSFCSRRFSVPDIKEPAKGVSDSFHAIYDTFNGGLFWDGALLIRPLWAVGDAPLAIADWNQEILWKGRYGSTCRDITFFAEDTFGCQFGLSSDGIVHFDPEIGTAKVISTTFEGWCGELCRDPEFYTGYPVLAAWERKHGKLAAKSRLIPKLFWAHPASPWVPSAPNLNEPKISSPGEPRSGQRRDLGASASNRIPISLSARSLRALSHVPSDILPQMSERIAMKIP